MFLALGSTTYYLGEFESSVRLFDLGIAVNELAISTSQDRFDISRRMGNLYRYRGLAELDSGQPDAGATSLATAIDWFGAADILRPGRSDIPDMLAVSTAEYGVALAKGGHFAEAILAAADSAERQRALTAATPDDIRLRHSCATVHLTASVILRLTSTDPAASTAERQGRLLTSMNYILTGLGYAEEVAHLGNPIYQKLVERLDFERTVIEAALAALEVSDEAAPPRGQ
jgi:hypothetical protein